MKPHPFAYHAPRTMEEVTFLLSTLENCRLLAGGQSLMAMMNMRFTTPDHLIDLNGVEGLSSIEVGPTHLHLGAMARQRDIEFSSAIEARLPIMSEAVRHVGHRQTRNRGTIGGSLCHLDASAELVTICSLCDATLTLQGAKGSREVTFRDFPQGFLTTSVQPDECLVHIAIPLWAEDHGYAFLEISRRHGDFAQVSVAIMLELDERQFIRRIAVSLGGVDFAPVRMTELEAALLGQRIEPGAAPDLRESCAHLEPIEDVHATTAYRRRLAAVITRRALNQALERAFARLRPALLQP